MKKGFILVALSFLMAIPALGQEKLVKSVERMAKKEKANLEEARSLIKPALSHPETVNDPHAWYVAGLIEEKAVEKDYLAMQLGQQVNEGVFYSNLLDMVNFYMKTDELDAVPDEKGRVRRKFDKKISGPLGTFYQLLVNGGAGFLDTGDFKKANEYFQTFLNVKKMDIFEGTPVSMLDSLTMQIGFFNAYAASQIEDNTENAIIAFESIKSIPYRQNDVYQLLAVQYYTIKDNDKYIETLKEGAQIFPEESFFLNNLVDAYIKQNKLDDAENYLKLAIAENPNKPELFYVYGMLYENGYKDMEKAIEYFTKSVEADPAYAQGYFGIARCYFNGGHELANNADLSDQAKYKADTDKAEKMFRESLPFFQKAVELDPQNRDYLTALSSCYYVLGMEEERAKVEEQISLL